MKPVFNYKLNQRLEEKKQDIRFENMCIQHTSSILCNNYSLKGNLSAFIITKFEKIGSFYFIYIIYLQLA